MGISPGKVAKRHSKFDRQEATKEVSTTTSPMLCQAGRSRPAVMGAGGTKS